MRHDNRFFQRVANAHTIHDPISEYEPILTAVADEVLDSLSTPGELEGLIEDLCDMAGYWNIDTQREAEKARRVICEEGLDHE